VSKACGRCHRSLSSRDARGPLASGRAVARRGAACGSEQHLSSSAVSVWSGSAARPCASMEARAISGVDVETNGTRAAHLHRRPSDGLSWTAAEQLLDGVDDHRVERRPLRSVRVDGEQRARQRRRWPRREQEPEGGRGEPHPYSLRFCFLLHATTSGALFHFS